MVQCNYTSADFEDTLKSISEQQKNSPQNSQSSSDTYCEQYIKMYKSTEKRWDEDKAAFEYEQLVVLCWLMNKANQSAHTNQTEHIDTTQILRLLKDFEDFEDFQPIDVTTDDDIKPAIFHLQMGSTEVLEFML